MISFFKSLMIHLKAMRVIKTEEDLIKFGTTPLRASTAAAIFLQGTDPYRNCGPTQDLISKALIANNVSHYRVNWYPKYLSDSRPYGSDNFMVDTVSTAVGHGNVVGIIKNSKGFFKKRWWMAGSLYAYSEISTLDRLIDTVNCLVENEVILGRAWEVNTTTGTYTMVDLRKIEEAIK